MSIKNTLRLVAFTTLAGAATYANAVATTNPNYSLTATGSLPVSITIPKACTVTVPTALAFGTVTAPTASATGNISVTCSNTTPYSIALQPSGTVPSETGAGTMKSAIATNTTTVGYQLSSTPGANGTVWGSNPGVTASTVTTGSNEVQGTGTGTATPTPVYAYASNTNVAPDTYTDTVVVTLNY